MMMHPRPAFVLCGILLGSVACLACCAPTRWSANSNHGDRRKQARVTELSQAAALPDPSWTAKVPNLPSALRQAAPNTTLRFFRPGLPSSALPSFARLLRDHASAGGLCVSMGAERALLVAGNGGCAQLVIGDLNNNVYYYHQVNRALATAALATEKPAEHFVALHRRGNAREFFDALATIDFPRLPTTDEDKDQLYAWWDESVRRQGEVFLPLLRAPALLAQPNATTGGGQLAAGSRPSAASQAAPVGQIDADSQRAVKDRLAMNVGLGYLYDHDLLGDYFLPLLTGGRTQVYSVDWHSRRPRFVLVDELVEHAIGDGALPLTVLDVSWAMAQSFAMGGQDPETAYLTHLRGLLAHFAALLAESVASQSKPLLVATVPHHMARHLDDPVSAALDLASLLALASFAPIAAPAAPSSGTSPDPVGDCLREFLRTLLDARTPVVEQVFRCAPPRCAAPTASK